MLFIVEGIPNFTLHDEVNTILCNIEPHVITIVELYSMTFRPCICDPLCINHPFSTLYSFEKKSFEVCVVTQLIDYSSYFHKIFNIASADFDLHETMSVGTYMASFARQFRCVLFFY